MRGQRQAILKHLITFGDITSMEAFQDYGVTRLAVIIHDFRNMGMNIMTVEESGTTRYGTACKYARYVMPNEVRNEFREKANNVVSD